MKKKISNKLKKTLIEDQKDAIIYEYSTNDNQFEGNSESDSTNQMKSNENEHFIQNWQFEIRKLTYEDSGVYQCSLPLVKPITKNVTLKVIRKRHFFSL